MDVALSISYLAPILNPVSKRLNHTVPIACQSNNELQMARNVHVVWRDPDRISIFKSAWQPVVVPWDAIALFGCEASRWFRRAPILHARNSRLTFTREHVLWLGRNLSCEGFSNPSDGQWMCNAGKFISFLGINNWCLAGLRFLTRPTCVFTYL